MRAMALRVVRAAAVLVLGLGSAFAEPFEVTILHVSDLHAHVEPFSQRGRDMGGYARLATLVERFRATDPNPVLLCAGDTFQGTLMFNAYEGLADLAVMNLLGFQAMAVGNHELDRGPAVLARFASLATFPLVAANLDASGNPELAPWIRPSAVLAVGGERLGVVGAVPPDLLSISNPGPTVQVRDLERSVQAAIDELTAVGINKVVLLSHLGYRTDRDLAARLRGVDVIVGGHSHTLLGTIEGLPQPAGEYPTIVERADGRTVPIVHSWDWGKVLGRIIVAFDQAGEVSGFRAAAPVPVDAGVPEHPTVRSMVAAFARPVEAVRAQVVGNAPAGISRTRVTARHAENPMGNVIADAMLAATEKAGSVAALVNSGGVRASLEPGPITYGDAITVQPFNNTLMQLDLTGAELKTALEEALGEFPHATGGLLNPSSGTSYAIDPSRPAGDRVIDLMIGGEAMRPDAVYRITVPSFLAGGGDTHPILRDAPGRRYDTGMLDIDALVDYLRRHDPVEGRLEGRIRVIVPAE